MAIPWPPALAAAGKKTALVERQDVGGTCINRGCTPTKTMVASARAAYIARRAADYGVRLGPVTVDMARVRERKRAIVRSFREGNEKRLQNAHVELIRGEASFTAQGKCASPPQRRESAVDRGAILYQHRHPQRYAGN